MKGRKSLKKLMKTSDVALDKLLSAMDANVPHEEYERLLKEYRKAFDAVANYRS